MMTKTTTKLCIYQVLPRLFGNHAPNPAPNGDLSQNGTGKFKNFNSKALKELKKLGATHIWYTGIIEHATQTDYSQYGIAADHPSIVKGKAGSPYAIKDYYDIAPDLATNPEKRMKEFEALIKRTHKAGIAVIIDFVPNHVARQYRSDQKPEGVLDFGEKDDTSQAFDPQNNFYYVPDTPLSLPDQVKNIGEAPYSEMPAKATGNDNFTAAPHFNDWYETIKLNYGIDPQTGEGHFSPIPRTWIMMRDILLFWAAKGVDGFRCDMAEMVPVAFWNWVTKEIKKAYPNLIFIAEVYNPSLYHQYIYEGGFDFLYDKVDLYDTLRDIIQHGSSASEITHCWQALDGLEQHMLRFLENHDEQRIASPQFATDPFAAIPAMVVCATISRGPVMVYSGQEVGEPATGVQGFSGNDGRSSIFDYCQMPEFEKWVNNGKYDGGKLSDSQVILRNHYRKLLNLCIENDVLRNGGFYDLQYLNYDNPSYPTDQVYSYFRYTQESCLLIVVNFDRHHGHELRIRLSEEAIAHVGLDAYREWIGNDIYTHHKGFIIRPGDALHHGVPTHIDPKQALIFEIRQ